MTHGFRAMRMIIRVSFKVLHTAEANSKTAPREIFNELLRNKHVQSRLRGVQRNTQFITDPFSVR